MPKVSEELTHWAYCPQCFDEKVRPAQQTYDDIMSRAKNVFVFYKTQSKETRAIKRKEAVMQVANCHDKEETLLRLAFLAAFENFNTLVDVEISSKKIITDGYQSSVYVGVGVPTRLDPNSPLLKLKDNH